MAESEHKAETSAQKAYANAASKDGKTTKTVKTRKPRTANKAKAATARAKTARKPAVRKTAKETAAVKPKATRKAKPKRVAKPSVKEPAKPVAATGTNAISLFTTKTNLKENIMDMNKNLEGVEKMITEAQKKAHEAFEKGTAMAGDYGEFAKGNVEALIESGKILAEGLQDMGTNLVAESRTAFESVSADMKGMAAAKSPTELLQLQSDVVRKNFDSAVAYGSKNTEAMLKLASDVIAPLTSRVNVAVEKVTKATA